MPPSIYDRKSGKKLQDIQVEPDPNRQITGIAPPWDGVSPRQVNPIATPWDGVSPRSELQQATAAHQAKYRLDANNQPLPSRGHAARYADTARLNTGIQDQMDFDRSRRELGVYGDAIGRRQAQGRLPQRLGPEQSWGPRWNPNATRPAMPQNQQPPLDMKRLEKAAKAAGIPVEELAAAMQEHRQKYAQPPLRGHQERSEDISGLDPGVQGQMDAERRQREGGVYGGGVTPSAPLPPMGDVGDAVRKHLGREPTKIETGEIEDPRKGLSQQDRTATVRKPGENWLDYVDRMKKRFGKDTFKKGNLGSLVYDWDRANEEVKEGAKWAEYDREIKGLPQTKDLTSDWEEHDRANWGDRQDGIIYRHKETGEFRLYRNGRWTEVKEDPEYGWSTNLDEMPTPRDSKRQESKDKNKARKEEINANRQKFNEERGAKRFGRPLEPGDTGYKPMMPTTPEEKREKEQNAREILSDRKNERRRKQGLPPTEEYRQRRAAEEQEAAAAREAEQAAQVKKEEDYKQRVADMGDERARVISRHGVLLTRAKSSLTQAQTMLKAAIGDEEQAANIPQLKQSVKDAEEEVMRATMELDELKRNSKKADDFYKNERNKGQYFQGDDPTMPEASQPGWGQTPDAGTPQANTESPYYVPPGQPEPPAGAQAQYVPPGQQSLESPYDQSRFNTPSTTSTPPRSVDTGVGLMGGTGELLYSPVLEDNGKTPFVSWEDIYAAARNRGISVDQVIEILQIQGVQQPESANRGTNVGAGRSAGQALRP